MYERLRSNKGAREEATRNRPPGIPYPIWTRRPTEAHGSGARKKRATGSLASETRRPGWQPGLLIPPAVLSPTRYRTWPGRPKHRARCAEVPLANHGVHGYLRYRRDSSRNLRPSPQAMHRPGPRTRPPARYCARYQHASSASSSCHFYTRPPITCLLMPAHGCYRTQRANLHTCVSRLRSRSLQGLVLREEFVDAPPEDVVHDHAGNGNQQSRRCGLEHEA